MSQPTRAVSIAAVTLYHPVSVGSAPFEMPKAADANLRRAHHHQTNPAWSLRKMNGSLMSRFDSPTALQPSETS